MNIEDLTIGQARAIAAMFGTASPATTTDHGACLIVADRGHVWYSPAVTTDGEFATAKDARIVRRWGTSEGVNELANKGPLSETRLDAPATVKVAARAIIAIIPTEASKWNGS